MKRRALMSMVVVVVTSLPKLLVAGYLFDQNLPSGTVGLFSL